MAMELEIQPVGQRFAIKAGRSVLDRFDTEEAAREALERNRSLYEYWAGSAGVKIENTPANVKKI